MVTLSDGTERPASRRYIPALKEAGLLLIACMVEWIISEGLTDY